MYPIESEPGGGHQFHVFAVRGFVGRLGIAGIPCDVGGDASDAAAAGRNGAAGTTASSAARAFQVHVNSDPVHDRLLHVLRLPSLSEALVAGVHPAFQIEKTWHVSFRFYDTIANLVGDLFAVRVRVVAKIGQAGEPAAGNPPGTAVIRSLTIGDPAGVLRKGLDPFV